MPTQDPTGPADRAPNSRRDFLKLASVGAPAAIAAATLAPEAATADTTGPDSGRMQDTAHTRAYLDSARF